MIMLMICMLSMMMMTMMMMIVYLGGWFGVGNSCARVQALATWRISRMMEIRKVSKRGVK